MATAGDLRRAFVLFAMERAENDCPRGYYRQRSGTRFDEERCEDCNTPEDEKRAACMLDLFLTHAQREEG